MAEPRNVSALDVPADMLLLSPSLSFVEELARGLGFEHVEALNIRLALEETLANVIEHGYPDDPNGRIDLRCEVLPTGLRLTVREKGLPWKQGEVTLSGHAIECRINAEDPKSLAPSPGAVRGLTLPGGPGVRLDTHLEPGAEVSLWYDSLVAKVLAHHETRDQARARMLRALDGLEILGLSTNIPAQRTALLEDHFARAEV